MTTYSETYLYKLHRLTNSLDRLFDQTLHTYARIGLTQFKLLLTVQQLGLVQQRKVAIFLEFSPAAISRQVDIAHHQGWIRVQGTVHDRRSRLLQLTAAGAVAIDKGIAALEQHAFKIFADDKRQAGLMDHIDVLLTNTKEAMHEQAVLDKEPKRNNVKE